MGKKFLLFNVLFVMTILIVGSFAFARSESRITDAYVVREPFYAQDYYLKDDLNLRGFQIKAWHENNTIETIDWDDERLSYKGYDMSKPGEQFVFVYFNDYGINQMIYTLLIEVKNEKRPIVLKSPRLPDQNVTDIYLKKAPNKTSYLLEEDLELEGMELIVVYEDGTKEILNIHDEGLGKEINDFNNTTRGYKSIKVDITYKDFQNTIKFNVVYKENIDDRVPVKVMFLNYPVKWEKNATKDEIDMTGSTFQVEFDDGGSEVLDYNDVFFSKRVQNIDGDSTLVVTCRNNISVMCALSRRNVFDERDTLNKNYNMSERLMKINPVYQIKDNLRDGYSLYNYVYFLTEDQGPEGLCWDFAATKSLETNYNYKNDSLFTLSEKFADYMTSKDFYGSRNLSEGGNFYTYSNIAEKKGVPLDANVEDICSGEEDYKNIVETAERAVSLNSVIRFPSDIKINDNKEILNEMIKTHIMNYGSVYVDIVNGEELFQDFYNEEDEHYDCCTYYYTDGLKNSGTGHAVSIIGWYDDFDKEYFKRTDEYGNEVCPDNNGAWYCLNSWGNDWGDYGTFWISYESEELKYYGVIDSEAYTPKLEYSYTEVKPYVQPYCQDVDTNRYFYVEFDKTEQEQLLSNIIVDLDGNCNLYFLDDYDDEIDFSKKQFLSFYHDYSNVVGNIVLDEPVSLSGDKFMIIVEMLECEDYPASIDFIIPESGDIHTYYTDGSLSSEMTKYEGNIFVNAYTKLTPEEIEILNATLGDVNDDGVITVLDIRLMIQAYTSSVPKTRLELARMDMNNDGIITVADIRLLIQKYVA